MSDSSYTTILWKRERRPLLRAATRAYVLTLHDSDRLHRKEASLLPLLCAETYIQINRNYKVSRKPAHVDSTATDLIHAYRNVCSQCRDVRGPVLILEDDAQLLSTCRRQYREVDEFIRSQRYDVYTLGSAGPFDRTQDVGNHRRFYGIMGFSHAIVWSHAAREQFLSGDETRQTHIDVHVLSSMRAKYTYRTPLVVQLFPTTENMSTWCVQCNGSQTERIVVKVWIHIVQKWLGLETKPIGWYTLYLINSYAQAIVFLLVASLVSTFVKGNNTLH